MRTLYPIHVEPVNAGGGTATGSRWYQPFSEPRRRKGLAVALIAASGVVAALTQPNTASADKWHRPFSEPTRVDRGLDARFQQAAAFTPFVASAESITADKWLKPFSEPRSKKVFVGFPHPTHVDPIVGSGDVLFAQTPDSFVSHYKTTIYQSVAETIVVAAPEPGSGDVLFPQTSTSVTYQNTVIYPSAVEPINVVTVPEVTSADKWFHQWTNPVRIKTGLATSLQQSTSILVFTPPPPEPGSGDVLFPQTSTSIAYQNTIIYPSVAEPINVTAAPPEDVTLDKWLYQWTNPVRSKTGLATILQQSTSLFLFTPSPPEPGSGDALFPQTSTSIAYQQTIIYPSVAEPVNVTAAPPENITPDKWLYQWTNPVRRKIGLVTYSITEPIVIETVATEVILSQTSAFIPCKVTLLYQSITDPVPVIDVVSTEIIISQTNAFIPCKITLLYQSIADPVPIVAPESITLDKWFRPLTEPQRKKRAVAQQRDSAFVKAAPFGENITPDKWYQDFGRPVRLWLRSYKAALSPFSFQSNYLVPAPYVDPPMASWSYGFSLPVRVRTSVSTANQATSATTMPIIPQPNPPPPPGVYTVSGLYVIDQFTDNTVVYDYDGRVSHRTN